MNVDVEIGVEVRIESEHFRARTNVRQRGARRLLHDIAEFSGERQISFATRQRHFRRQNLAADFRPRQTGGETDLTLVVNLLGAEFRFAEEFADFGAIDGDGVVGAMRQDLASDFAQRR